MKSPNERPDGFVHVWDYPDDPDEPCWHDAALKAVDYVASLVRLDPNLDFKIECQTVDWREEKIGNYVGANYILMNQTAFDLSEDKPNLSVHDLGLIVDGFITGWMSRSCEAPEAPVTIRDVHTEHCCEHSCKYGEEDCTVTAGKAPASYPCDFEEDTNPMHAFGQGRGD